MNIGTDSTTYSTNSFKNGLNIMRKEFDWASLWTDWSVWPDGLTCSEDPLLYCVAATCHRIGKIVTESSYRVAESSQSFTELSCLVAESSCHRIGQLTNRPVPVCRTVLRLLRITNAFIIMHGNTHYPGNTWSRWHGCCWFLSQSPCK